MNMERIHLATSAYKELLDKKDSTRLDFFEGLWEIQDHHERALAEGGEYKILDKKLAEEWYWNQHPFFLMSPIAIDEGCLISTLEDCTGYLIDNAAFALELTNKMYHFDWSTFIQESEISLAGQDPMAFIEACCKQAERKENMLEPEVLSIVLTYALRPQLSRTAKLVMDSLSSALVIGNGIHDKPLHCPACGGKATAAYVGETLSSQGNGRLLYCTLCGTDWEFERIRCACCGTRNQGHLHYYHIDGDNAHRLHNCQECGGYMRTIFQEESVAPLCFEVEDVVMTKLDSIVQNFSFDNKMK